VEGGDRDMKKVVVVVGLKSRDREVFIGEELNVFNKSNDVKNLMGMAGDIPNTLVIRDKGGVIAVFNQWLYWRKQD